MAYALYALLSGGQKQPSLHNIDFSCDSFVGDYASHFPNY